ncbi:MAG: alpha-ketoglutarate-dependent dioxygenase AlkB [Gammaproteobacteria bacterium]|nr:alpha-ketoglutarate-dependent dioxygenase AlkB [Gammaproteobacteria bacterium]
MTAPRLVCWYGDPRATYCYSNVKHTPLPWTPCLQGLRQTISQFTGFKFNSVLGNLYHDGQDSMGWHADNEKQLGNNPVIASLSLGAKRLFKLRHNKTKLTIDIALENGSLLLMAGSLQHHWRHCLAKTRKPVDIRINLTFRYIQTEQD